MEKMTMFEEFIFWLSKNRRKFTIYTEGLSGPRMYKQGKYTFIEAAADLVIITSKNFRYKANNIDDVIRLATAIK